MNPPARKVIAALAGNPNAGKTTIFNNLTGSRQKVGNYPGVTVEKKFGALRRGDVEITVVDLPGTYALTAFSQEEVVARNFVVDERPDVVVDIVDASNLERNLYLTTQFMELEAPLVLALNMSDVAARKGYCIDCEKLASLLGTRVVRTVGNKAEGMDALLDEIAHAAESPSPAPVRLDYGREIEEELAKLSGLIGDRPEALRRYPSRWLALKLLEGDQPAMELVAAHLASSSEVLAAAEASRRHLKTIFGDEPEIIVADRRYGFISGACQEAVRSTVESRHSMSDSIDGIILHPALGLPIFLITMYIVFQMTFALAEAPMRWLESAFALAAEAVSRNWPAGAPDALRALLTEGVIGGVGGVIAFLPNILLLFLAIAVLEDTGYMARAAFVTDRLMHKIGLHGKSFIPMLIGFGCSVPAILATRTLDTRRDRLTTMLVVPLMSCGARLTIYALFIPAFFSDDVLVNLGVIKITTHALILWLMYLIGIALAALLAQLLRKTLFAGETAQFVMELPPYRMPTFAGCVVHTWERGKLYLWKAGTVILGISIILWALTSYPKNDDARMEYDARLADAAHKYESRAAEVAAMIGAGQAAAGVLASGEIFDENYFMAPTGDEDRKKLANLFGVAQKIALICSHYENGDDGFPGWSQHYDVAEIHRNAALAELRRADTALFDAAARYLENVRGPMMEEKQTLANERRAAELRHSIAGRIGGALEKPLNLIGFDWRIATALIGAFAAKEVFVAQMGIVFSVGETGENSKALREKIRAAYSPLAGFCVMLFCLIGFPCMATAAATWRESGSWKWAALQFGGLTLTAYVVTLIVYQVGSRLGIGI
ncbi:MAG TPA: ferrous iron transport protein B [Candidatus Brocadiia bacterium]|nr:ferrous iron transport protein B [Candidatus Brocadiia bacterium]